MEVDQKSVVFSHSNVLKRALNLFHRTINHHGPYDVVPKFQLSSPPKVVYIWPEGEMWSYERQCIYICDSAALNRLHTAMSKLVVIDNGLVWPHVNFTTEPPTLEWLMFTKDVKESYDSDLIPYAKEWFLIPSFCQDLMDYVACLHDLVPLRETVELIHQVGVKDSENSFSGTAAYVSLTTIILQPGDIVTSFFECPHSEVHANISSDSSVIHTKYLHNNASPLMDTELKFYSVIHQVPGFLELFISRMNQYRKNDCLSRQQVSFNSEVTIKEDPFTNEAINFEEFILQDLAPEDPTVSNLRSPTEKRCTRTRSCSFRTEQQMSLESLRAKKDLRSKEKQCRLQSNKHSGKLLQCPKCPATYKFGVNGKGLGLILGHVHSYHQRLTSYCTSVIRKKYAVLMEDSKVCG